jgi:hypothetical protein
VFPVYAVFLQNITAFAHSVCILNSNLQTYQDRQEGAPTPNQARRRPATHPESLEEIPRALSARLRDRIHPFKGTTLPGIRALGRSEFPDADSHAKSQGGWYIQGMDEGTKGSSHLPGQAAPSAGIRGVRCADVKSQEDGQ